MRHHPPTTTPVSTSVVRHEPSTTIKAAKARFAGGQIDSSSQLTAIDIDIAIAIDKEEELPRYQYNIKPSAVS